MFDFQWTHYIGRLFGAACVLASLLAGCSSDSGTEFGRVQLSLSGTSLGTSYELADARFEIDGLETLTLTSEDSQEPTLTALLPVGDYSAELQPGWRLLEVSADGSREVDATLISENPIGFAIEAEATTRVAFVFRTEDGSVGFGEGTLELGIEVEKLVARQVIFSELMKNPVAIPDSSGEWLELSNTGTQRVDLSDCVVRRDTTEFTIDSLLSVEPGQSVTLANSDAPGFTPDYVYSSLTLPNATAFSLELSCGEELMDSVNVNPAATPNAAGASLSLDPAFASRDGNDAPGAWCDGSDDYNAGDLGSPGTPNPSCP